SGDNLIDPVTDRELINVADLFYVDEHYLKVYDIELLEGKNFDTAEEDRIAKSLGCLEATEKLHLHTEERSLLVGIGFGEDAIH
ncbi:hypothetical protein, partial [Porphyromonas gingivalis]|uniref:hypothetical protein n=1 Tax=Porphyromonas gingivalis TaxID=837 RepID=UPI0011804257